MLRVQQLEDLSGSTPRELHRKNFSKSLLKLRPSQLHRRKCFQQRREGAIADQSADLHVVRGAQRNLYVIVHLQLCTESQLQRGGYCGGLQGTMLSDQLAADLVCEFPCRHPWPLNGTCWLMLLNSRTQKTLTQNLPSGLWSCWCGCRHHWIGSSSRCRPRLASLLC